MMKVAEEAIVDDPHLEKVTIMNHAPRFDTKDVDPVQLKTKLATFANSYFLELWLDSSMKDKIIIGSHTLEIGWPRIHQKSKILVFPIP